MKRYNITAPIQSEGRIIIDAAKNGEWVRYEDVSQFVDCVTQAHDSKCYCYDLQELGDGALCASCQLEEAIDEFRKGNSK